MGRNVIVVVGVLGMGVGAVSAEGAVSASIVPGTLVQGVVKASLGAGTSYAREGNDMGDWVLDTGGVGVKYPVTVTNADFNGNSFGGKANTMVAFGDGGGVTLKFGVPVRAVAGEKEIGVFTGQMMLGPTGSLFNGNMEAAILVSADGVEWRTLEGEVVGSPGTYVGKSYPLNAPTVAYVYGSMQKAWAYGSGVSAGVLGGLEVADYQRPMVDDSVFNGVGATDAERRALAGDTTSATYEGIFGGSGGGNWFDISGSGLDEVEYVRLNGVNVPGDGGVRLDGVFANAVAVPEPGVGVVLVGVGIGAGWRRGKKRSPEGCG